MLFIQQISGEDQSYHSKCITQHHFIGMHGVVQVFSAIFIKMCIYKCVKKITDTM